MSNRIDQTQFDAITKGQWEVIDTPGGGIDIGVRQSGGHSPVVTFTQSMGKQVKQIPRDVADMNAIAAVPDLIDELKRRYEELDEAKIVAEAAKRLSNMIDPMWEKLDGWMMFFDDYSMHRINAVEERYGETLDEKYALDNLGNIILKELYFYTEEDGWQRKESASE